MNVRSLFPSVTAAERPKLMRAMAAFACAASTSVVARTAGSTLFLTRFEPEMLSYMYVASSISLMMASFSIGLLTSRFDLARVLVGTAGVLVVCLGLLRIGLSSGWAGYVVLAYPLSELSAKIPVILFWAISANMFNAREGRRLFVLIGVAGTGACALVGSLIGRYSARFGTENLFFLVILLVTGFAVISWRNSGSAIAGSPRDRGSRRSSSTSTQRLAYYGDLLALPQVRFLTLLVVSSATALMITDYLFKSGARAQHSGVELAAFFGHFYSATSIATLLIQLFIVHQVMRRWGVFPAAAALPCVLLILSIGVSLTGDFRWIVAAKVADPLLDFTLNAAAVQLLYLGIRKASRSQARTLIDGIARPAAAIVTGLTLVVMVRVLAPSQLAVVVTVVAGIWLASAWFSYRAYVSGLMSSIGAQHFDFSEEREGYGDPVLESRVREMLPNSSDSQVIYLLGVMASLGDVDWTPDFRELLKRDHPSIRVAALEYLVGHGDQRDEDAIAECLASEHPSVRKAATKALVAVAGIRVANRLRQVLDDPDPEVRATATAELLNLGDLDALLDACISLKLLLSTNDEKGRVAAARALGSVNLGGVHKVLGVLLEDSDPGVRRAALEAVGKRRSQDLIPDVLRMLSDPEVTQASFDTLASFGSDLLPYLDAFPEDAKNASSERFPHIPELLAKTEVREALDTLERAFALPNLRLRTRTVAAYCELAKRIGVARSRRPRIMSAALDLMIEAGDRVRLSRDATGAAATQLLERTLGEERDDLLRASLLLVELLHPSVDMSSVLWALTEGSAERRAQAIEILDNVLDGALKDELIGMFEPTDRARKPSRSVSESLEAILVQPHSEGVLASAVYASGLLQIVEAVGSVQTLLGHGSAYVRETALDCLRRIAGRDELVAACALVADDPALEIRLLSDQIAKNLKVTGA